MVLGSEIWEKYVIDTTTLAIPSTFDVPGSLGIRGRYYYYPHFMRGEPLSRGRLNHLKSHSKHMVDPRFEPRQSGSRAYVFKLLHSQLIDSRFLIYKGLIATMGSILRKDAKS